MRPPGKTRGCGWLGGVCSLGAVLLIAGPRQATAATYVNTTPIVLGSAAAGPNPYPSPITVSRLAGEITSVAVTLMEITHPNPDDIDVLLVGPGGQTVLLLSDAGGAGNVTNVTVTFAEGARAFVPDAGPLVAGVYLPSNYDVADSFPNAPAPPYPGKLSIFDGTDPNGTWRLYALDDSVLLNPGAIAGGWRLTINTTNRAPVITVPLVDQTVPAGADVVFRVGVSGTPPFGYQWLRDGVVLVPFGQGTDTLRLFGVQAAAEGIYTVQVTNGTPAPAMASSQARLDVVVPLRILEPLPTSIDTQPGGTITLIAKAEGEPPLRYQWLRNGMIISNATSSVLRLTEISPFDAGTYSVRVWNGIQSVRAGPTRIRVFFETGPPLRDFFQERPRLQDADGIVHGDNTDARAERDEPVTPGASGRTMWLELTSPDSGIMTVRTRGSEFDTVLRVYRGADLRDLRLVTQDDDQGGFFSSELKFNVRRGESYLIQVDGTDGSGRFTLSWNLEVTQARVPVLVRPPLPQVVKPGEDAVFNVATETADESYQWFFLPPPYEKYEPLAGETGPTLVISKAGPRDVGFYAVGVRNGFDRFALGPAVALQLGNLPYFVGDKLTTMYSMSMSFGTFLPFGLGNSVNNTLPSAANRSEGDPDPCDSPFFGTLWLGLAATNSGVIQVETTGSAIPTRLAVYKLNGDANDFDAPALICDLSSATNGVPCVARFDALRGTNYTVVVEGYEATGNIALAAKMGIAPALTNTLKYCLVAAGGSFLLQMPATAWCPAPACQWRFNGIDIPDATNSTLSVSGFGAPNVGLYSVWVSNFVSTATRDVASLDLAPPFALHSAWVTNGSVGYRIAASNASPFVLETATTLGGLWTPVATNPDPCLILLYTNKTPFVDPRRFYRAVPWTP